ncbi:MAG: cytochrome c oxidase assembly protein [Actinomycetota bacterium]
MIAHVLAPSAVPPAFTPGALLSRWQADPFVLAAILVAGILYWWGVRRVARTPPVWPWSRTWAFYGGLLVCVLALLSPIDTYQDVSFSTHMLQHVLLLLVAAPLFALGTPVTLALRAATPDFRRNVLLPVLHSRVVRLLSHPVVAWILFAVVQYVTHFTSFYELALDHEPVHALEHALYLLAGVIFWWPVVGLDPAPRKLGFPARVLYVVLAMPLEAFLGVAILSASHPLYRHYQQLPAPWGGAAALRDQGDAGSIMWIVGELASLIAVLCVAAAWFRHDEARQRRIEEDLDRAAVAGSATG